MRCPWCDELVPDDATFCHRCGNKLVEETQEESAAHALERVISSAPGDWRTVAKKGPVRSPVRKGKKFLYGFTPLSYALLLGAIALWIGLSLTLWGNPSPLDRSSLIFQAIARAEEERFLSCFRTEEKERGKEMWVDLLYHYGAGVSFENLSFKVESDDGYEAVVLLVSARLEGGKHSGKELTSDDGIRLHWVNLGGSWYLDPLRSRLIPR